MTDKDKKDLRTNIEEEEKSPSSQSDTELISLEQTSTEQNSKQPISIDFSVTYINEKTPINGEITSAYTINDLDKSIDIYRPRKITETVIKPNGNDTHSFLTNGGPYDWEYEYLTENGNLVKGSAPKSDILLNKKYNYNDYANIPTLSNYRKQHKDGQSVDDVYNSIKSFINENKDNEETIKLFVSNFLNNIEKHYDNNKSHLGAGEQKEVLSKLLNAENGSEIDGLICGTIHEFMMNTLNECGIEAAMIIGEYGDENHVTLIYKSNNGEYVFNNYGVECITVKANNVIDAVKEVEKLSGTCYSAGNITICDGKNSIIKYALETVAYRGDEIDKNTYNNITTFNESKIADKSSIKGDIEVSNKGNISFDTQATIVNTDGNEKTQTDFSVGGVKKGESSLFHESLSIGSGVGYKKSKTEGDTTTFFNLKGITSYIKGTNISTSYNNIPRDKTALNKMSRDMIKDLERFKNSDEYKQLSEEERAIVDENFKDIFKNTINFALGNDNFTIPQKTNTSNYFTVFARGAFGKTKEILKNDDCTLNIGGEIFGTFNATNKIGTIAINGDFRIGAEGGLQFTNIGDNHSIQTSVSAGVHGDFNPQHVVTNLNLINPGTKFNVETSANYAPTDRTILGFNGNLSTTASSSSTNLQVGSNIYCSHKINNETRLNIVSGAEYNTEDINVGQFHEKIENNLKFSTQVSVQKNNSTLYTGYSQHLDKMNATRDNISFNVGYRRTF